MSHAATAATLILVLQALPVRLEAQTAEEKAWAKAYFAQGKRAYQQERFLDAARDFKKAYAFWQHTSIPFNVALAYARAALWVEAAFWTSVYQKRALLPPARLPPELRRALSRVGTLEVRAVSRGAMVFVDSRSVGRSPLQVFVLPGRRRVEIRLGKRRLHQKTLQIRAGRASLWDLRSRPATRPSWTTRRARPTHDPRRPSVRQDPYQDSEPVRRGRAFRLGRIHWAGFTTAAAVLAGALAAAIAMSKRTLDTFHDFRLPPAERPTDLSTRLRREQRATNALWGLTAASAVAAGLFALFTRWRRGESAGSGASLSFNF